MASDSVFHKAIPDPALVASVDRYLKEQESKRAETALQCQKALVYIDAYEKLRQAITEDRRAELERAKRLDLESSWAFLFQCCTQPPRVVE